MANERKLTVVLAGDAKPLKREVDKADRSISSLGDTFGRVGSGIAKFGKMAAVGVAGLAVATGVIGKGLYDAAVESQKVGRQTAAVIKSMGGASKVSAKQVANLAETLSEKAGIDDELIQSGANVLLTFGKIRNEVGKGNKVFDRATEAALNMSVALGTDMKAATIQIGKALNDPIKGLTALSKAGVSFTDDQKKRIKWLTENNRTMAAQKIILGELEKQFGGSAAAQATAGDRLRVIWGNLQEDLGARLLPVFETVATWLSDKLPGAFDFLGEKVDWIGDKVSEFWKALTTGFSEDEGTALERVALGIRDAWDDLAFPALERVANFIQDTLLPRLGDALNWFVNNKPALVGVLAAISAGFIAWFASATLAAVSTWAAILPLVPFIALIGAAAAAIYVMADRGDGFSDTIIRLGLAVYVFGSMFVSIFKTIVRWVRMAWDFIGDLISRIKDLIGLIPRIPGIPGAGSGGGILDTLGGAFGVRNVVNPDARAMGGPVTGGGSYVVGERGPELFTPETDGHITPNHELGGSVVNNYYIAGDMTRSVGDKVIREQKRVRLLAGI